MNQPDLVIQIRLKRGLLRTIDKHKFFVNELDCNEIETIGMVKLS